MNELQNYKCNNCGKLLCKINSKNIVYGEQIVELPDEQNLIAVEIRCDRCKEMNYLYKS
ncbi:MAG: hypothetical protein PWP27_210 [Clostridiales bacterium]|nr:hypothetical protein [Clostridiales bacterium]